MNVGHPSTAYLWFDTEYSSLDLNKAVLLQVALVISDAQLHRIGPADEDVNLYIRLPKGTKVSPWIEENMQEVLGRCRSDEAVTVGEADQRLAAHVDKHVVIPAGEDKRRPILSGNSLHSDWLLARKYLPQFCRRLHYRHLDVTALKLQWQDWFRGGEFDKEKVGLIREYFPAAVLPDDGKRHDAHYDVQASIAELNYYRKQLMKV